MRMSDIDTFELRNLKQVRNGNVSRVRGPKRGKQLSQTCPRNHSFTRSCPPNQTQQTQQIPDRSRVFHVRTQAGPDGTPTAQLQHRDLRDIFASVGPLQVGATHGRLVVLHVEELLAD